jgi:peroxiredoxin
LERLHREFKQDPFVLLAIDVGEEERKVKSFVRKKGLSFPILLDYDNAVAFRYGIRAHPVDFLIDIKGNIIGIAQGYRKWDKKEMKVLIRSLLPKT